MTRRSPRPRTLGQHVEPPATGLLSRRAGDELGGRGSGPRLGRARVSAAAALRVPQRTCASEPPPRGWRSRHPRRIPATKDSPAITTSKEAVLERGAAAGRFGGDEQHSRGGHRSRPGAVRESTMVPWGRPEFNLGAEFTGNQRSGGSPQRPRANAAGAAGLAVGRRFRRVRPELSPERAAPTGFPLPSAEEPGPLRHRNRRAATARPGVDPGLAPGWPPQGVRPEALRCGCRESISGCHFQWDMVDCTFKGAGWPTSRRHKRSR